MQTYAEHPEYFKTNYKFLHNVCPGFFIKNVGGTGNMAKIWNTELIFYWTRHKTIKAMDGVTDSTAVGIGYNRFDGTEEVLQLNKIENDTKTWSSWQVSRTVLTSSHQQVSSPRLPSLSKTS